jgi:hypothetical protein
VGGPHVVVSWTAIREEDGTESSALVLYEPSGNALDPRSRVRFAPIDTQCRISRWIDLPRSRDPVDELFVTRTTEGGETLAVLGTRDAGPPRSDGLMRWLAYRLGRGEPVWRVELRSAQSLAEAHREHIGGPLTEGPGTERGYWPLRIRTLDGIRTWYRWDGETLVPDRTEQRPAAHAQ